MSVSEHEAELSRQLDAAKALLDEAVRKWQNARAEAMEDAKIVVAAVARAEALEEAALLFEKQWAPADRTAIAQTIRALKVARSDSGSAGAPDAMREALN